MICFSDLQFYIDQDLAAQFRWTDWLAGGDRSERDRNGDFWCMDESFGSARAAYE